MNATMYDLIYSGAEDRKAVAAAFPDAVIEDASDGIHDERFSVTLPAERRDEWLLHLAQSPYGIDSLTLGLMICMEPDKARDLLRRAGRIPQPVPEGRTDE